MSKINAILLVIAIFLLSFVMMSLYHKTTKSKTTFLFVDSVYYNSKIKIPNTNTVIQSDCVVKSFDENGKAIYIVFSQGEKVVMTDNKELIVTDDTLINLMTEGVER